jgi:hypothetical protein
MAAFSTIALLTMGALEAGKTAVDFTSQRKEAKSIEKQGDFEAMLYGRNADYASKQATDATARGEEGANDIGRGAGLLNGAQRAGFAAAGLDINSGSAADVQSNDSALAAIDQSRVRLNAAREAAGYTQQAEDYRMEGAYTRQAAKDKAHQLRDQSVLTLLSGAGKLANTWASAPKGIARASLTRSTQAGHDGIPRVRTVQRYP